MAEIKGCLHAYGFTEREVITHAHNPNQISQSLLFTVLLFNQEHLVVNQFCIGWLNVLMSSRFCLFLSFIIYAQILELYSKKEKEKGRERERERERGKKRKERKVGRERERERKRERERESEPRETKRRNIFSERERERERKEREREKR